MKVGPKRLFKTLQAKPLHCVGTIIIFVIGGSILARIIHLMKNAVAKIQWMEQGKILRLMISYGAAITPL